MIQACQDISAKQKGKVFNSFKTVPPDSTLIRSEMELIDSSTEMKVTDVWKSRYRENFLDSTDSMPRKGP